MFSSLFGVCTAVLVSAGRLAESVIIGDGVELVLCSKVGVPGLSGLGITVIGGSSSRVGSNVTRCFLRTCSLCWSCWFSWGVGWQSRGVVPGA